MATIPNVGTRSRIWRRLTVGAVLVMSLGAASTAFAQSVASGTIEGTVKDESGSVLPGVTVTAASPQLQVGQLVQVFDATVENRAVLVEFFGVCRGTISDFHAPKRKQPFYASAAVDNDLVVIGSRDNKVWAIDRKTGKRRWDYLTDHKVDGSAVIVGDRVFVGSFDKRFYVLDKKGQKVADFELDGAIMGSPAVAGGCVVIGTEKGTVYCFGAK